MYYNCSIIESSIDYFDLYIYVSSCMIISVITNLDVGGALYVETTLNISLSDITFYKCITLDSAGGAIYCYEAGNFEISRVCALNCSAFQNGQFAYFYIPSNNNITLDYVSISKCADKGVGTYTIMFYNGNLHFSNDNISWNINKRGSGFYGYYIVSFFCHQTTFHFNIVYQSLCFILQGGFGLLTRINFIYNRDYSALGLFYVSSNISQYYFNDCNFHFNSEKLFYSVVGKVYIQNSIFYPFFYLSSNVFTFNLTSGTFISNMTHYYTKFFYSFQDITCHADMTPISENNFSLLPIRTLIPTLSETLIPTLIKTIENTIKPTKCIISTFLKENNSFLIPIFVSIFLTYFLL